MNPTGKGGFGDHPELINAGGRPKNEESVVAWMHHFLSLTVTEFRKYESEISEDERTVAESIAYARVFAARGDLKESIEVTNRTEGLPRQTVESVGEQKLLILDNGRNGRPKYTPRPDSSSPVTK